MTMQEFEVLCGRYNIPPDLALENDEVVALLIDIRDSDCQSAKRGYRNLLVNFFETGF